MTKRLFIVLIIAAAVVGCKETKQSNVFVRDKEGHVCEAIMGDTLELLYPYRIYKHDTIYKNNFDNLSIIAKRSIVDCFDTHDVPTNVQVYVSDYDEYFKKHDTLWGQIDLAEPYSKVFFSEKETMGICSSAGGYIPNNMHFKDKEIDSIYQSKRKQK